MRLFILGKDKLGMINVNDKTQNVVSVNYSYSETLEFPINLEKKDDGWHIIKNDFLDIGKDNTLYDDVLLNNYEIYFLNLLTVNGKIVIIPTNSFEKSYYNLSYSGMNNITIGSNANAHICYSNPLMQDIHATIKQENGYWVIEANPNGFTYVNNVGIIKAILKPGDIIFINGVKIIWNKDFIRVNNPTGISVKGFKIYENKIDNKSYDPENDLLSVELYKPDEYYYPKLLITGKVVDEEISISSPPTSNKEEEIPAILTLGSSITMLGSSFMMTYTVIYSLATERDSIVSLIPQIVMCVTMIIGSLILPKFANKYTKKQREKKEKKRIEKYTEYLNKKKEEITNIITKQEVTLKENNPSTEECKTFISGGKIANIKFWSRDVKDNTFLTLRLGNGDINSKLHVGLPEREFTLDNDELEDKMYEIGELSKKLHGIPITLSLTKNNKSGIIFKTPHKWDYINGLLLQLITLHSPYDLKIVIFTNKKNERKWNFMKYTPHVWSDNKQLRFFATDNDEIQALSEYLSNEYRNRKLEVESKKEDSLEVKAEEENYQDDETYKKYQPYYLLIDDNYRLSKNSLIVNLLSETATNFGFSYLGIGEQLKDFPNDCSTFVEVNDKNGDILSKDMNMNDMVTFNNEIIQNLDMRNIVNQIANIPIMTKDQEGVLPDSLTFLEMMDASRIEQLNIINRWKTNNPVASLATTIGVHSNGDKFKLDLHEKFHGPHGLVAGSTGSGKSEFIITYILSMIINYHPYEVQFILIDYKGGGLAGAFQNKEQGYKIPHLVGTITNLDIAEMNRTLVSIESECRRRQKVFNDVRDKLGESTIDIYKYQRLYREGAIKEPMAHLFIISDEFAELKAQQPDFMDSLISVARIGRSLGIHLILATQKPSGVVNDQIWSNSKFKVCLKVQDRSDSMEMLKRPEAASIKEAGRFYLQVGYDDYFDIGQSGWSGAKYIPTDNIIKKIDDSINFVGNVGNAYKTSKEAAKVDTSKDYGDQLTNIVKTICTIADSEQIKTKTLWLDAIPSDIYIDNIKKKYSYTPTPFYINPVIGEYDNPGNQEQGILTLDITYGGNTLIYGQTGSGKEQLLSTLITSTALEHNPEEVNIYILDFGAETLRIFTSLPHVGDIATVETPQKVEDTFNMIYDIIEERKKLFADYSGSYNDYIKSSGQKLPLIMVIINNYEIFTENHSNLSDDISTLYRDATKYGIMFIISVVSTNAIRSRITQYFNNKICLQIPEIDDYRDILGAPRGMMPAPYFGRGLINLNGLVTEFQTAQITIKDKVNETIRSIGKQMNEAYTIKAKPIPSVPDIVEVTEFENQNISLNEIPVGYDMINKKVITYDMTNVAFHSFVTESMGEEKMGFFYSFTHLLTKIPNTKVKIVDLADAFEKNNDNLEIYKDNWDQTIIKLHNDILNGEKEETQYIYVILGVGLMKKMLSPQSIGLLNKALSTITKDSKSKFVLIDVNSSFKNLGTETWYQTCVDNSYGIWLGENVGTQLSINITNLSLDDRKVDFPFMAFVVNNGKHKIIKHMIEKVEQNEE